MIADAGERRPTPGVGAYRAGHGQRMPHVHQRPTLLDVQFDHGSGLLSPVAGAELVGVQTGRTPGLCQGATVTTRQLPGPSRFQLPAGQSRP